MSVHIDHQCPFTARLDRGGGQRKGILWKGTRAWSDVDKKAGIAFLAQVYGDKAAQDGDGGFRAGHVGFLIQTKVSSS